MGWKGWESFKPTPAILQAGEASQASAKLPRVRNARRCWVTAQGAILKAPLDLPDLLVFDSQREARRWLVLREQARLGEIVQLRRQVPYPLNVVRPDGHPETVARWIADFVYFERSGVEVVEDCKGFATEMYRLKRRWFFAQYGFVIKET